MATDSPVWLVTGTSTGIGRVLTETLAQNGHRVVATARKPQQIADFAQNYPEFVCTVQQDVNSEADNKAAVQAALDRFGRIDVLVNNAGYGLMGTVEETEMPKVRHQMETNFFGLVHLTQQVLPHMRAQGSGFIFNVASIAGLRGFAGMGIYNASKFAVVGLSEALAQEVKQFGIQVGIVEPGPYRTDWAGRSLVSSEVIETKKATPYENVNEGIAGRLASISGKQPGDPKQIATVLISCVENGTTPLHLLFGDEGLESWEGKLERLQNDRAFMDHFPHSRTRI